MLLAAVVLLIAVTVLFTFSIRDKDMPPPEPVSPTRHLEERKAAIYENLRDLQFEYRVGKLSDADYQQTKLGLQKELAGVLAEIEKVTASGKLGSARRRSNGRESQARNVCPHCGAKFPKPMKFCGECGKAMRHESCALSLASDSALPALPRDRRHGDQRHHRQAASRRSTVNLVQPGADGMQTLASRRNPIPTGSSVSIKSFRRRPHCSRRLQGRPVHPGAAARTPTTGIQFEIYESPPSRRKAIRWQHMIMIEPSADPLEISETFLIRKRYQHHVSGSSKGRSSSICPRRAGDTVQVSVTPPTAMPIQRPAGEDRAGPASFKIDYPVEARRDAFRCALHAARTETFSAKIVPGDRPTLVVTPNPVTCRATASRIRRGAGRASSGAHLRRDGALL